MKRRQFLSHTAVGAASAATLVACNSTTSSSDSGASGGKLPRIDWRMATSWPNSLDTIFGGAETVCQRVSEMTDGRFTITPFAAGEIVGGLEVLDAVQGGSVECGHTASYYYVGKNSALGFATSVPFGLTAQQQNAWLYEAGGLEAIQKVYADFNIINFPAGNTGAQMGGWFKREVKSLNELQGLTMRLPGLGGEVMSRLGVTVQNLPGGEIYVALERGAIDAAEWVGPYDDEKLGLNKVAPFYYYPGWWEPGPTLDVLVNRNQWDSLPREYQAIFQAAAKDANLTMLAKYNALNRTAFQSLKGDGTKFVQYSQDIMQAAQEAALELYADNSGKNPAFKEVYEQWKSFREEAILWNEINELSFTNFVSQALTKSE
ncbi:TRAP transporter substrate-binding protein [Lusitaniella coriacea LEGE 07157]|uniref:TRAP transporter substrate-binding protein n=1 Tax=Lusitaniella coriacea LEGE 07157 TaxID=945747 RepID=A0A8J7AXV7_9CYAN|nr:TRAP transporter substrate-binding protein [Lusitaniella coriacea]MBE9114764.1 TRAP transporter substrate-binding protein [Lusitaniella coriacea LEGE 07157]